MNILYLEQSEFQKKIAREILETQLKHRVSFTEKIDDAIEILEKENIDVILASAHLMGDGTKDLLLKLGFTKKHSTPVLILTSDSRDKVKAKYMPYGVVDIISKKEMNAEVIDTMLKNIQARGSFESGAKTLKIGVIDDSKITSLFIMNILKKMQIEEMNYFADAVEFLSFFNKDPEHFDVLFVDLILPGESGLEIIEAVRNKNKLVPIIAISSLGSFKTISFALDKGADEFLKKPFDPDLFMIRMKIALKSSKMKKKLYEMGVEIDSHHAKDPLEPSQNKPLPRSQTPQTETYQPKPAPTGDPERDSIADYIADTGVEIGGDEDDI